MTARAFIGEVFRAHFALYGYHRKQRDDEEVTADIQRAAVIRDSLSERYGADGQDGHGWFMDAVRRAETPPPRQGSVV